MASLAFLKSKKRARTDDDSDSDTDNDFFFLTKDNWPRFIVVKSASEERPLSKLSPFAVQKGASCLPLRCRKVSRQ